MVSIAKTQEQSVYAAIVQQGQYALYGYGKYIHDRG